MWNGSRQVLVEDFGECRLPDDSRGFLSKIAQRGGASSADQVPSSLSRKISAIHANHCYNVVLRNLSVSGAFIEGILNVPKGSKFVLDFGDGQLAVSSVIRSMGQQQALEFEERLVSDGNGGLFTNRRISPYMMAAAGMPLANLPPGYYLTAEGEKRPKGLPAFSTASDWKAA